MSINNLNLVNLGNVMAPAPKPEAQGMQDFVPALKELQLPEIMPSDFMAQSEELRDYLSERDAEYKEKNGGTPKDTVAVAMPVIPGLGVPFVSATQQRKIDAITEQYAGKRSTSGMMDELFVAGVHPWQIAANARFFINPATGGVSDAWSSGMRTRGLDITV